MCSGIRRLHRVREQSQLGRCRQQGPCPAPTSCAGLTARPGLLEVPEAWRCQRPAAGRRAASNSGDGVKAAGVGM